MNEQILNITLLLINMQGKTVFCREMAI